MIKEGKNQTTWTAEKLKDLENILINFPAKDRVPPTFLEISKYPNNENAISNILSFYLDPENEHRLGTIFLDALIDCFPELNEGADPLLHSPSNIEVIREVSTNSKKRIDLLINTDEITIGIENKIFHDLHHDLVDYKLFLDSFKKKRTLPIVLSLKQLDQKNTQKVKDAGFKHLSYSEYIKRIKIRLAENIIEADSKYLVFLKDFIESICNLEKGPSMNTEFRNYIGHNPGIVKKFLVEIKNLRKDMRRQVEKLREQLDDQKTINHPNIEMKRFFYRESAGLFDILVHDINISQDTVLAIDTRLDPGGWEVLLFFRHSKGIDSNNPLDELMNESTRLHKYKNKYQFGSKIPYDNTGEVKKQVEELINTILEIYGK